MKMTLRATHLEITDPIQKYVEKKLGELDKYVSEGTMMEIDAEVARTTNRQQKGDVFVANANIVLPGALLRAETEHEDLYAAIDLLKDELQRELRRHKEKQMDKEKQEGLKRKEDRHAKPPVIDEDDLI